jgi:hypothetical protein
MLRVDSSRIEEFRGFKDIKEVQDLQPFEFQPSGGTPLLDAFGYVITKLDSAIQERGFDKIIVVVYADGGENTSSQYKKPKIKDMVTKRQNTDKWAFIFMGRRNRRIRRCFRAWNSCEQHCRNPTSRERVISIPHGLHLRPLVQCAVVWL